MAARGAKPQARAARGGRLRPADLLKLRPSHYEDETRVTAIADAEPGVPALFEGICEKQVATYRVLEFVLADDTGRLTVTFVRFNPGMRSATAVGKRLRLFGQPQAGGRGGLLRRGPLRLVHPRLRGAEAPLPAHLTARYPKVAGFSEAVIARHVQRELLRLRELGDPLPPPLRRRSGTLPLAESLRLLHRPQPHELPLIEKRALPSLKFDEWLAHIAFKQRQKSRIRHSEAPALAAPAGAIDEFAKRLPFVLTACQRGAMEEIAADLGGSRAMRRLLHGDVGSGKTVVAAFACWLALRAGRQAAIMCPTVILASQHHRRLKPIFAALGFECHLLVSATKATERRALLQRLATQQDCFLVIGTHSLVQDEVEMPLLSLAVIDEQQRFSVAQRKKLESKARVAHVLMMSATPIPITLELGMLAHLDTSRLVEKPQRGAIRTLVFNASRTDEVLREIVRHQLQTYWICPLIKQGAAAGLRAAEDEYERIRALLPGLPAALIHGSMDSARKLAAMNEFETGAIRLLVATTVVEVGIDAPEADAIVINHAERLGLSQLHQLRGRVGRGSSKGFCALLYDPGLAEQAVKRLRVIHAESDGFAIAREDLRLRGPGDLVGKRQSRAFKYVFADLFRDAAAVEAAQKALAGLDAQQLEALQPWLDFWLGNLLA
ncbi:MAG: ATP-dependent DNA helicase RecG [Betaproteobacteria bacterium AqS2]|uniref:ATP-dependent DNA helicase RecG n=1 Tax=Candidatus Amphirhobacter heronislandensis TaxID=1732024 RepID=A0A930UC85_9GAMM|nr:ATP-dependent DNA helicase RecG [Betaproteobacteria bacterium AqS2]